MPASQPLFDFVPGDHPATATLKVHAGLQSPHRISSLITGKFCEHLGSNINHGMLAQILQNPTFASFPFFNGRMSPDGRTLLHQDPEEIAQVIRRRALDTGWPAPAIESVVESYREGLACWWIREGAVPEIKVSPDTGPHRGRAQRFEVAAAGQGIAQWTYLPLHRVRSYEVSLVARAVNGSSLKIGLYQVGQAEPIAQTIVTGLSGEWATFRAVLHVPPTAPAGEAYRFAVTAGQAGEFIIERVLLCPADHVDGNDPDVIRRLRESHLPVLRWPGGNFVSGYDWRDGIGPQDRRPTRPNPAWGGVEPNLFGTDEFILFCRAVGCAPMICINAGDGTPEEAAAWVEYCNGPATSPMGSLRAANGSPKPYNVRHWEVGNELWGNWQVHWTTPTGYVDRYAQFSHAMRNADPTIKLYACGAPVLWGKAWNDTLIAGVGTGMDATTDHPLIGGHVPANADPLDVYRDFMGVPSILERRWEDLRRAMAEAGIIEPELAITELQLFAHLMPPAEDQSKDPTRFPLTQETLVTPATHCEAVYDILIYHTAIRLAPFVRMVTHSATINHGGGLRKERERVYANPCHHAQSAFTAFAGAVPVAITLSSAVEAMPIVLGDLRNAGESGDYPVIDALAAIARDGALLLSLVHRGSSGPIEIQVELDGFHSRGKADILTLAAEHPWDKNSLGQPDAVTPRRSHSTVDVSQMTLTLQPWSVTRVRIAC